MLTLMAAGMPRTGTTSLKVAFQLLGYDRCMHMQDLFNDPDRVDYWIRLFETGTTDFETLFEGYESTTDIPACLLYKELLEAYPDLKVVLNYRDPESWYNSMIETVRPAATTQIDLSDKPQRFRDIAKTLAMVDDYLLEGYFDGAFADRERTIAAYEKHYSDVRAAVPSDQLLEYRIEEGWEPLCDFLGVPVPDQPFPRKNTRDQFKEKIGKMISGGGKLDIEG